MAQRQDEFKKPTNIVQIASLVALVALTFIDARFEDFEVSLVVYGIIGGLLLGVTNIGRLFK